jgi:hypothetical protein
MHCTAPRIRQFSSIFSRRFQRKDHEIHNSDAAQSLFPRNRINAIHGRFFHRRLKALRPLEDPLNRVSVVASRRDAIGGFSKTSVTCCSSEPRISAPRKHGFYGCRVQFLASIVSNAFRRTPLCLRRRQFQPPFRAPECRAGIFRRRLAQLTYVANWAKWGRYGSHLMS